MSDYTLSDYTLIHGDCLQELKNVKDNSIDLVLTDPPYMISSKVKLNCFEQKKDCKVKRSDISFDFGDWDKFSSEKEYIEFTNQWFELCAGKLRKGGHFVSFFDKHKISYLVNIAKQYNFKPRQCLFWIKTNPVFCVRKVNFMNSIEMLFWATKETTERKYATFNYQLGLHTEYIMHPICMGNERKEGNHTTQKPVKVLQWIISYLSNEGDIVLDPFMGSGSTGVACKLLKRKFIGIEQDEKYFITAQKRILSQTIQEKLILNHI